MNYFKYGFKVLADRFREKYAANRGSASYWSTYLVAHDNFVNREASLEHFLWRNDQYPGYIDLMPVNESNDLIVVDYGCGPGNDLVGFNEFSNPKNLIGIDVSKTALKVSERRLVLHEQVLDLIHINEDDNKIPLESNSVDLVHSSGVLHHVKNLNKALYEIRRILKPGGSLQVMVYNYESVWLHLYTAYNYQIKKGLHSELSLLDAFRKTTDGPYCPISRCYKPNTFVKKIKEIGFSGEFTGAAISLLELSILPLRFKAIQDQRLAKEHREFLSSLQFNQYGHPIYNSFVAGIDACFKFIKI